jgi:vacuolar-type H+-ATPase subunit E/Vma4
MSLETIIEKIISEAEAEAARLRQEAQERAEQIVSTGCQQAEKRAAALQHQAEQEGQLEALRILSQARLEKRLTLLQARRKWVERVLDKAVEAVGLSGRPLQRTIITHEGRSQEELTPEELKEDLRLRYEKMILEILGL